MTGFAPRGRKRGFMKALIHTKHFFGAGALLLLLAIYLSVMIDRRQDELSRISRYDLAWTASQTVIEIARLGQALGSHAISPQLVPADEVHLRYDLLVSRVSEFEGRGFKALTESDPEYHRAAATIQEAVSSLAPLIAKLDQPDDLRATLRILASITPEAAMLASGAQQRGGLKAYEGQRALLYLHWTFSGLTFALFTAGAVLLYSLARQNRLLAHTRLLAERAKAQAEIASQAKTDFLAGMSHEMRTPLNGIMGFTELILDDEALSPELRRRVELIGKSSSALLTVVNDVLDFSKIEAGAIELDPKPFSPEALVKNCISITQDSAARKGVELTVKTRPCVPHTLVADEPRVQQILLNLLNNAIKFTPAGVVSVDVNCVPEDGGERLKITVTDTGIGIPLDKQGRLFQRFSQVDGSASRHYGGTGLGLAISKSLVTLMGGAIGFQSEPGRGSSFWFTLPFQRLQEGMAEEATLEFKPSSLARRGRILLAEDIAINQEIVRTILEAAGHHVDVVFDGTEAVRAFQVETYDLVLMDVQMPGMDGVEATRHIRALGGDAWHVPILALTANVYSEQVSAFIAAGMNGHIGKPVRRAQLLEIVERWLGPADEPDQPASARALDDAAFREIIDLMGRESVLRLLDQLADHLQALPKLEAHLDDAGRRHLAAYAHKTVSAAGMLGFKQFSSLCREIETACATGRGLEDLLLGLEEARQELLEEISQLKKAA